MDYCFWTTAFEDALMPVCNRHIACLGCRVKNNIVESLLLTQQYMSSKTPEHELLFDLLQKMMEYDSSKRITLEQAIAHPFFNPLRKERKWLGGDIEWTLLLPGRLLLTVSVCFKTACFITSVRIYFHFEYAGQIPLYFWQIKLECFKCTPLVSIYFVILIVDNSGLNIRAFAVFCSAFFMIIIYPSLGNRKMDW